MSLFPDDVARKRPRRADTKKPVTLYFFQNAAQEIEKKSDGRDNGKADIDVGASIPEHHQDEDVEKEGEKVDPEEVVLRAKDADVFSKGINFRNQKID